MYRPREQLQWYCIKDGANIDPLYNTGKDFVYDDDFEQFEREYLAGNGLFDSEGNRLASNLESNRRTG